MSEVKVNKISPRSGTEVTLGDSGDTFTIPSGATINNQGTATNFGATGSASWVTTVKTSTFTAVAGEGYFVNTTGGVVTVNLPAGTAGAVVAVKDYAGTFDTNNVTLVQNGSDKIGGLAVNTTLSTEGLAVTLVFVDSTQGWLVTDSGLQSEAPGPQFITATGGTITTVDTNFKVHTFTGPGTFTVCSVGNPAGSTAVDYLVVAGGGGGSGGYYGGGGGAGGFRTSFPGGTKITTPATSYPITVGGGGAAGSGNGASGGGGSNSCFSTIASEGGGFGKGFVDTPSGNNGGPGGSGGGAGSNGGTGGIGNTPPTSPPQGNNGGSATGNSGGGGGGSSAVGGNSPTTTGGAGTANSITNSPLTFGVGGNGGAEAGGGNAGTTNRGNGGEAAGRSGCNGGVGGSGIVIIRYKFQ